MGSFQERHRLSEPLYETKAVAREQVSSELEDILSNSSLSGWSRLKKATWVEMRTLYVLAAPAIIVYLLNNVISMSTQIFGGHLGNVERAAGSIGNNRMHLLNYGLLLGMGSAVETVCGQAYGAHKNEMLGVYLQKSAILLTATGILIMISYIFCKPLQILFGESPRVAPATTVYVYGLIPQIFAYAANFPIQKFLQAQSIVNPSAYIAPATLVVHVFLTWLVLYVFEWGLVGVALVSSLSWWIIVVAQFVYILRSERCKTTWIGFSPKAFSGLWSFWKLSSASAVLMCLETWYFQITILLARLLPNPPEVALDSLSICGTTIGWAFMISVGFNAAASVRVSNELGAGHPKSASFAVVVVTLISTIISTTFAVVSLGFRHQLSYIFTRGTTLSDAVSDLAPLLAIYIVLNGIHPVLSGVAIGCGRQGFVCNVSLGCYYAVGVPLGALLGFKFNLGAKGIWSGMLGGVAMQTIILLWVTVRTDWNKEVKILIQVEKAQDQLRNWEDSRDKVLLEE